MLNRDQVLNIVNQFGLSSSFETPTAARLFYIPGTGFLEANSSEPDLPIGNVVFLTEYVLDSDEPVHRVMCLRKTSSGFEIVRVRRLEVTAQDLMGNAPLSLAVKEISEQLGFQMLH